MQVWLAASFAAVSKIYGALYSVVATFIQYMVPPYYNVSFWLWIKSKRINVYVVVGSQPLQWLQDAFVSL